MGWNGCGGFCALARDAANISIAAIASACRIHDSSTKGIATERPFRNCAARYHGKTSDLPVITGSLAMVCEGSAIRNA